MTHRNQFQTGRKEERVLFRVPNEKSAERWEEALKRNLENLSLEEEPEEEMDDVDGGQAMEGD